MLDGGTDVKEVKSDGESALMAASRNGHTDVAALLISRGADVNVAKRDGYTAFMLANNHRHTKTAAMLIKHGANVNKTHPHWVPGI